MTIFIFWWTNPLSIILTISSLEHVENWIKVKEFIHILKHFVFFGALQTPVTVFLENKSINVLQNIFFVFHGWHKVAQIWNEDNEKQ